MDFTARTLTLIAIIFSVFFLGNPPVIAAEEIEEQASYQSAATESAETTADKKNADAEIEPAGSVTEEAGPAPRQEDDPADDFIGNIRDMLDGFSLIGIVDSRAVYKNFYIRSTEHEPIESAELQGRYIYLGLDFNPNKYVSSRILFLYEDFFGKREQPFAYWGDGSNEITLNEGWVRLQYLGAYAMIGSSIMNFMHETTFAVKDPLMFYYGDLPTTFLRVGYDHDYIGFSLSVFNGNHDQAELADRGGIDLAPDVFDGYVASFHTTPLAGIESYDLELGLGFINDITEAAIGYDFFVHDTVYEQDVWGISGYIHFEGNPAENLDLGIELEYSVTDLFSGKNYRNAAGDLTRLQASNAELAFFLFQDYWIGIKHESIIGLDWMDTAQYDEDFEPTSFHNLSGFAGTSALAPVTIAAQGSYGFDNEQNNLTELTLQVLYEY